MTAERPTQQQEISQTEQTEVDATARLIMLQAERASSEVDDQHQRAHVAGSAVMSRSVDGGKSYFVPNNPLEL
ncbi:MAG: hypothetical protein WA843_03520 [Candidatus Saccharimonadales bacterium]